MNEVLEKPFFEHDCPKCIFLGNFENKYDLYFCGPGGNQKDFRFTLDNTVIARYGNDGPEYVSGMVFADENAEHPVLELVEAKKRAIKYGLMT